MALNPAFSQAGITYHAEAGKSTKDEVCDATMFSTEPEPTT